MATLCTLQRHPLLKQPEAVCDGAKLFGVRSLDQQNLRPHIGQAVKLFDMVVIEADTAIGRLPPDLAVIVRAVDSVVSRASPAGYPAPAG